MAWVGHALRQALHWPQWADTGSVGGSTLDVMALHPGRYEVFALTAFQKVDALAALCRQWRPRFAAVGTPAQADALRAQLQAAKSVVELEPLVTELIQINLLCTRQCEENTKRSFWRP